MTLGSLAEDCDVFLVDDTRMIKSRSNEDYFAMALLCAGWSSSRNTYGEPVLV